MSRGQISAGKISITLVLITSLVLGVWFYARAQEEATSTVAGSSSTTTLDNFDSYTSGALYGRGIWQGVKSGRDWMVNDSNCPAGSASGKNCLALERVAAAEFENTVDADASSALPYSDNVVSFSFYPKWSGEPTVVFNLYFLTPGAEAEQLHLDFNTDENNTFYVFLSNGLEDAVMFNLPLKQWHKVELNINKDIRRARFRVNDGEWTNFVSWINQREDIGLLRLRGVVEGEANFYLDDFSVSEFSP